VRACTARDGARKQPACVQARTLSSVSSIETKKKLAITMRVLVLILAFSLSASSSVADERDEEIAKLKKRITVLEAHNRVLSERLTQIAALAAGLTSRPQADLAIIVASDDWGDAQERDVGQVLNSAALPVWESAGSPPLHPIAVANHPGNPLVAYERGPLDTYIVLLNVRGRLWAKLAYQFSHEMAHILANYRDVPNKQRWFEEAICECASLYSLRRMARTWKTTPPYPNWSSYADSLTDYANDRINGAAAIPNDDLTAWYSANKSTLDTDPTNRELNQVVAVELLPIFEKYPNGWKAVRSLNLGDPTENGTFHGYLKAWYSRVSESERPVVSEIATLFSVTLPER